MAIKGRIVGDKYGKHHMFEPIDEIMRKEPHIEYQDKLYNAQLAIEAAIGAVEMYQSHETHLLMHLGAVKEMIEARVDA